MKPLFGKPKKYDGEPLESNQYIICLGGVMYVANSGMAPFSGEPFRDRTDEYGGMGPDNTNKPPPED